MKAVQRRKKSFFISTVSRGTTSSAEKSAIESMRGDWRRIERAGATILKSAHGCYAPV